MVWRGGVQYICLTRTTNLAYLDAKEWTNMYFEPLISVKCCPKLHIKQLRNNLHYICLWDRVGLEGGGHRWKGGVQEKGGGSGPPDPPPSGHAYVYTSWETVYIKASPVYQPSVRRPINNDHFLHYKTYIICRFYLFVTYVIITGR